MNQKGDSETKIFAFRMSRESQRIYVKSRRAPMIFAGVLFVLPWLILGGIFLGFFSKSRYSTTPELTTPLYQDSGGPWGVLDCYDYVTDPPTEFLSDDLFPKENVEWYFGNISRDALGKLFESSELPKDVREQLLSRAEFSLGKGWVVHPADEVVLNMAPISRQKLYDELAKIPDNQRHVDPFVFKPEQLQKWLADDQLLPETIATVNKLLYPHNDRVLLPDAVTLLSHVPDKAERIKLLNVLLRRQTKMVKLRMAKQPTKEAEISEIDALAAYWGAGGRVTQVQPFIESLHRNSNGMRIDIALLLPPFARDRLYMYPLPSTNSTAGHRDCHWTALNFFNETPDDSYCNPQNVAVALKTNYNEVSAPLRLGDIALFETPEHKVIHSCVYIASDLYFSKNGPSRISPWVLMRLVNIHALFPAYPNLQVKHVRLIDKTIGSK